MIDIQELTLPKTIGITIRELVDVHVDAPCLNLPVTVDFSANIKLDNAEIPIDRFIYGAYCEQTDCELWERLNKQESCTLREAYRKNANLLKNETLLNGTSMRPQTFFDRFITEEMKTLETQNKAVYERFVENPINVNTNRIAANPCGVLSDIFIRANEMSEADFRRLADHPSGYNYFSPFKVGEYEYKDALYRIKIKKDNGASNPLIYDYRINVDIDDVKDRGTIDIPAEETRVYFNRNYYTEPDVVVNVVSGEEGKVIIPFIISTDGEDDIGRYFTVILKDTAGNPVSGTISWNSNGY